MPRAPSTLRYHPGFEADLQDISGYNSDAAERILRKVADWEDKIQWGRVPQEHLKYLTGSARYNFYRERVGNSGYRVVYEISGDEMTALAALPKDDNTYDLDTFRDRLDDP